MVLVMEEMDEIERLSSFFQEIELLSLTGPSRMWASVESAPRLLLRPSIFFLASCFSIFSLPMIQLRIKTRRFENSWKE